METESSSMMDFSLIFELIWKIIVQILFNEGVVSTLMDYNIDLSKYINMDDNSGGTTTTP